MWFSTLGWSKIRWTKKKKWIKKCFLLWRICLMHQTPVPKSFSLFCNSEFHGQDDLLMWGVRRSLRFDRLRAAAAQVSCHRFHLITSSFNSKTLIISMQPKTQLCAVAMASISTWFRCATHTHTNLCSYSYIDSVFIFHSSGPHY